MRNVLLTLVGPAFLLWVTADPTGEEESSCDVGGDCSYEEPSSPYSPSSFDLFGDLVSSHHPDCVDKNERDCPMKALLNACVKHPDRMLDECPLSCGLCNNYDAETSQVRTCYGELQNVNHNEQILHVIRNTQQYMTRQVFFNETFANIRSSVSIFIQKKHNNSSLNPNANSMNRFPLFFFVFTQCKNRHVNCSQWAWEGECEKNPNYMKK